LAGWTEAQQLAALTDAAFTQTDTATPYDTLKSNWPRGVTLPPQHVITHVLTDEYNSPQQRRNELARTIQTIDNDGLDALDRDITTTPTDTPVIDPPTDVRVSDAAWQTALTAATDLAAHHYDNNPTKFDRTTYDRQLPSRPTLTTISLEAPTTTRTDWIEHVATQIAHYFTNDLDTVGSLYNPQRRSNQS